MTGSGHETKVGETDRPLVSVVVPAYNVERYIGATLESVLSQTYRELEIVMVNDGSTDSTREIAARFAGEDGRVRLVDRPNGGLIAARNTGISASSGSLVALLDGDDIWHPEKIERQVDAFRNDPQPGTVGAVYCHFRAIDERDRVLWDQFPWQVSGAAFCRHLAYSVVGTGSSLLCPKDVLLEIGGFDLGWQPNTLQFGEDFDAEVRIAARYRLLCVPQYLVGYRQHDAGMSRKRVKMAKGHAEVVRRYLRMYPTTPRACRKYATGSSLVLECGAYLRTGRPIQAMLKALELLAVDPQCFFHEVKMRASPRVRALRAGSSLAGSKFYDLDPGSGDIDPAEKFLRRRLSVLADLDRRIGIVATS